MSINLAVLDGVASHLALRYDEQSRPELRFTLAQTDHATDGKAWTSYWPCCASGSAATRLAEEIEEGQHIVLSAAKLCYRKRDGKSGLQSRMEILVWQVDRLTTSPQDKTSTPAESDTTSQGAIVASEPKARRPRYPKYLGQPTRN